MFFQIEDRQRGSSHGLEVSGHRCNCIVHETITPLILHLCVINDCKGNNCECLHTIHSIQFNSLFAVPLTLAFVFSLLYKIFYLMFQGNFYHCSSEEYKWTYQRPEWRYSQSRVLTLCSVIDSPIVLFCIQPYMTRILLKISYFLE